MPDPARSQGLVLDTSVWINLLATEMARPILGALETCIYTPGQVVDELKRNPVTGEPVDADEILRLGPPARASIVALEGPGLALFFDIVGQPAADALGDGEAAAIAFAASHGVDLVIDDRKARRIVGERFAGIETFWTVDLLRAPSVVNALGSRLAEECFAKAQRFGRMHVPRS